MDYKQMVESFSWEEIRKNFDGDPDGIINIAHEACDRWADDPNRVALYWEDSLGNKETWTYRSLKEKSNQMANALHSLGINKGDRVAGLLGKDMELVITILAAWKVGAIYVPLFTAFGQEAIMHRLSESGVSLLVTTKNHAGKIEETETSSQVLLTDGLTNDGQTFWEFIESFTTEFEMEPTSWDDPAVIQFTSGTTGMPKGAINPHRLIFNQYPYAKFSLNITEDDVFFGGADLGWSYGLVACTFGPLSLGVKTVIYNGPFEVEKIYQILEKYEVTNLAYAPTAYRMMMTAGKELLQKYNIKVRRFSSAGEPLDREVVRFFRENFGRAIYDHYGATEIGMMINNFNSTDMPVKPGSMGLPMPGFKVALVNEQGEPVRQGDIGQIAVDWTDSVFKFIGYWNNPEKVKEKYVGKWFLSGDLAKQDEDGYFWFQGRADDVISSAGYRIGPTEVEACIMEHPAVLEAAVVGKPDHVKGEIVKAYVILKETFESSESLANELSLFVKKKLSKHQYPREVEFLESFPKTDSGKTQRFLLKKREYERHANINK